MLNPYFNKENILLYNNDCLEVMSLYSKNVNMIFADPPYFLSNGGKTISNGHIVSVDKGEWDKPLTSVDDFNYKWIKSARNVLTEDGTIWICGTLHNIYSVVNILTELDFKILNSITWKKTNPPPNFSCRYFTHSSEVLIWARKNKKVAHYFNYDLMKRLNGNKQMQDVWEFPSIALWEKKYGKHPTQKPLSIICRSILASSKPKDLILDPFCGSCTTGVGSLLLDRRFIGCDIISEYLDIGIQRLYEAQNNKRVILNKIKGISYEALMSFDGH